MMLPNGLHIVGAEVVRAVEALDKLFPAAGAANGASIFALNGFAETAPEGADGGRLQVISSLHIFAQDLLAAAALKLACAVWGSSINLFSSDHLAPPPPVVQYMAINTFLILRFSYLPSLEEPRRATAVRLS